MIKTKYAGNMKIDVEIGGFKIRTDQPDADNTAANPFQLFLASFAACTAVFALFYLDKYGISREGVSVDLDPVFNNEGLIGSAKIIVTVPKNFPAERESGLKHTVERCKVGRHLNFPHEVVLVRK